MAGGAYILAWIALGGAAGSVGRYLIAHLVQSRSGSLFPLGTMTVNVLGCLAIGYLAVRFDGSSLPRHVRLGVLVGLLGGFTTFSTFSLETLQKLEQRQALSAALNIIGSVVLCLAGCWLGQKLARMTMTGMH